MSSSSTILFRTAVLFCFLVLPSVSVFADTIRLKDGSIIKGRITAFGGGKFTVTIGEGSKRREIAFEAAEVESISFDRETSYSASANVPVQTVSTNSDKPVSNPRVVTTDNLPVAGKKAESVETKSPSPIIKTPPVLTSPSNAKPIEVSVKVAADNTANGWTNSGWVVRKGQKIKISGSGEVSLGGGKSTSASGLYDLEDEAKLLKSVPTGALIAVIGDDNNEFIYIGSSREFTATRDGALFLGVNEGNLNDNSGSFDVKVEIAPDSE